MDEEAIFAAALECETPEMRQVFVKKACAGDARLQALVEELLQAHDAPDSFLQAPAANLVATVDDPIRERPGTVIGPYKLMEQIGEGGMGLVFVAEQQQPVRRKVALKVIKPGMDSRQVVARFEAERQALALMDHPNIAKVHDGGTTASGRPYFVMELVKGVPITDYCDQNQVPIRQRLELFVSVCQAVQHAHQKGIIHRDLKPSNVLVVSHDGTPVVKVIDFGVAKAIGQQLTDKTIYTQFSQMVGTPLYMSPEQAGQSGLDVDTRSDIYALGVLVYELLTGTTPFDKERLCDVSYDEIRRIIREDEPPRPSTRISTLGKAATTVSTQRQSEPKRLSQLLRGELDWIVMKALDKDRNRRYETASAFAVDVQRYLNDEPVQACPPSAWYRFRKFARRNRTKLGVVCLVLSFIALLGGGAGWVIREQTERQEALDQQVGKILDEADDLIKSDKWPEALAVVERADKLLVAAGRREQLPRLETLRKELTMAERLERIYREPKRELTTLVNMSSGYGGEHVSSMQLNAFEEEVYSGRQQDTEFAKAFRDFGIDIEALDPTEAAAQITNHQAIYSVLVKSLDEWASLRRRARGDNDARWKKLVQTARAADPDDWRNRCRDALLRRDRQALEQLADAIPIRQMPPASLCLLGHTLKDVGAVDKALDLLRRAQHEYPSDLWINDALAYFSSSVCKPPRWDDALRFYTVVLALRPGFAPNHRSVADALKAKGAVQEALVEYSRAIELDPKNVAARQGRGAIYKELHEHDKALADLSKVIELEPNDAKVWHDRGWFFHTTLHQYDKAVADYTRAIELSPKNREALNNRGLAYELLGQKDKARADWAKSTEWEPENAWEYRNRGGAYMRLDEHDKAFADFCKVIELAPKADWAWFARAYFYDMPLRKYDRAVADLSNAIELNTNDIGAWTERAQAYTELHQYDKALADYSKAIELDPKNDWAWFARAYFYDMPLRKYDRAVADFSKAVELHTNNIWTWLERARAYKELHQYDKALADYSKAIELDPKFATAWHNRGLYYYQLGQMEKALQDYSKAIELAPKYATARSNRGVCYEHLGQMEKALQDYSKAIELAPKYAAARNNRGVYYMRLGQMEKALQDYSKAIELDPKDAKARSNRGVCYEHLGQMEKALQDYSKAIELNPTDASAWNRRAGVNSQLGRYAEALADHQKALELAEDNAKAHNNLAWFLATCPDAKYRDPTRAVELVQKAVELTPKEGSHWNTLGVAHYRAGDWKAAVEALDKSREYRKGGNAFDFFFLAMACWQMGQKDDARKWYKQAVQWMEKNKDALAKNSQWTEELRRFRAEAKELLNVKE